MAEALTTDAPNAVIADQGMVYVRFLSGEVQAVDASPMELMKKINRGVQVLADYGQFGSSAYYMDHPFEALFQAGGARELSAEQVIDLGYHLRPPLVPTCERHVGDAKDHLTHTGAPGAGSAKAQGCWRGARPAHFPQLERVIVPPAPDECEYCGRDDFSTERSLKQHQSVMHGDRRQQQELGDAIVAGLQRTGMIEGGRGGNAEAIAAAVAATLRTLGIYQGTPPQPDPNPEPEDEDEETEESAPDESEPTPEPDPQPEPASNGRRHR
ncbi:MAG TPA: hypothetical protein VFB50_00350 [Chloroflexota bacterium]|nr:hypothetical protein [Chloroflexota bacterium]